MIRQAKHSPRMAITLSVGIILCWSILGSAANLAEAAGGGVQEKEKSDTQSSKDAKNTDEDKKSAIGKQEDSTRQNDEVDPRPKITRSKSGNIDKNKAVDLTFDDIKFEMEKGSDFKREMLTKEINELDHQKVRLRGFIRPSVRQTDLTKFVFVRDNKECCFGPGAALYDCVLVELDKGEKTDFTVRPVTIEGEFYLKEFKGLNGKIWAIYRMKKGVVK